MPRGIQFSPDERNTIYQAIRARRDVRAFKPDPIPDATLWRILEAAHCAPSVGFMQPWNFILVTDQDLRQCVYEHFREVNSQAAGVYSDDQANAYRAHKLQGILDAPMNILVTCDRMRGGPDVLGRFTMPETDVYSTCLAIQNLWIAARAEGIGVGWMSLMRPEFISALFELSDSVIPVAYLCLGYPVEWPEKPLLERTGWGNRLGLEKLVFVNRWGATLSPEQATSGSEKNASLDSQSVKSRLADRFDRLATPRESLGKLEQLSIKLADVQCRARPQAKRLHILVMAGDHGVAAQERVSAYDPYATVMMVYRFISGSAVVNALARQIGAKVDVVDMGVNHDFAPGTAIVHAKIRRGTRNFCVEPAMTVEELEAAISAGRKVVADLGAIDVLALGEMGIGNSTSASALAAAILGLSPENAVGKGSGVGPSGLARKVKALARAWVLHGEMAEADATEALRRLGGYEIAGLVGAIEEAFARNIPVVLDGFIVGVAALIAAKRNPDVISGLIAGTRSTEPAHTLILQFLKLDPLLDLELRLGEASGAVLALQLVQSACQIAAEVCTYEEANVDEPLAQGGRL